MGFCGGYLVLGETGRPIEFHCTLPVLPERAQTILYGEALRPCLFSEHIGPPLIARARTSAPLVLVNQTESLGLGRNTNSRVALVQTNPDQEVAWQAADVRQAERIDAWLKQATLDLMEPFERICSAIEEAHLVTTPGRR